MKLRVLATFSVLWLLCVSLWGCGDKFYDPAQVGRFRPVPAVNVILDSLGVAEETPSRWKTAEDPRPVDVSAYETDYVFGPGDIVRVSIFELLQEGVPFVDDYVVTETGKVSVREVGVVEAKGLTETQLEDEIRAMLSPGILKDPSVTVTLMSSQRRTFSILGNGVPNPGRFPIPRYDYRLNNALAEASVSTQFNVSYIYVTRAVTGRENFGEPVELKIEPVNHNEMPGTENEMLEIIAPAAVKNRQNMDIVISAAELATDEELAELALPEGFELLADADNVMADEKKKDKEAEIIEMNLPEGFEPLAGDEQELVGVEKAETLVDVNEPVEERQETIRQPIVREQTGRIEWEFKDGRWIPVKVGEPQIQPRHEVVQKTRPARERAPEEFGWEQIGQAGVQSRVIKIPTDKLAGGDHRYNIVIRAGDTIHVPLDIIGEFCIMGNTNNQGYITLTGRPMTLKMAIAAAGGLGPLAWPKRCEVARRIGKDKEEIVMVDLDKIASGEQPDFFIKPNDLVNVGTHPTSRWRAVLRNAFRATYGFGFIYDRNFADRDFGTSRPIPNWF